MMTDDSSMPIAQITNRRTPIASAIFSQSEPAMPLFYCFYEGAALTVAFGLYSDKLPCKGMLVITIWCSVALGSVLSISLAGTQAQYNPHLGLNIPDQDALATHQLTVQYVRQMFAVDRELVQILKEVADLDARAAELERRLDSERFGIIAVATTVYEAMPEIAQILRKHKISARDYLLTKIAAMIAEVEEGALAVGALLGERMSEGLFSPALRFWTAMDPRPQGRSGRMEGST
jgi:hypothetical protein